MSVLEALYDKLVADGTVTALVGTYRSLPCIFTSDPIPEDAPRPYVQIEAAITRTPFSALNSIDDDQTHDVYCIADNTGSEAAIETLAEAVKASLHRQPLTLSAGEHVMTLCDFGPIKAPTDSKLTGRVASFRVVTKE